MKKFLFGAFLIFLFSSKVFATPAAIDTIDFIAVPASCSVTTSSELDLSNL